MYVPNFVFIEQINKQAYKYYNLTFVFYLIILYILYMKQKIRRSIIDGNHSSVIYKICINPYPTAFPYGNGKVLHFYQQQESSTTKTVHKVNNKGLKTYV